MLDEERQPLVGTPKSVDTYDGLPWSQVAILAIWRAAQAVYFGYILTWITPFLLLKGRMDPSTVATTAGWIESAYSLGLLTGLAPASFLADNIGRKSTVMSGVLLASIGVIAFGFAEKVSTLIILRFYTGIFAAFIPATILTALIELSNPKTLPMVFAVSSVAWMMGSLVAPSIGGFLAEPAVQYPEIFAGTIWEEYPYALPGVAAACIPVLSTIIGYFVLEETLPRERRRTLFSLVKGKSSTPNSSQNRPGTPTPLKELFTRPVCFSLFCWSFFIFMLLTHLVAEVLFLSSPVEAGGLNLSPRQMGILYSIRPLLSNLFTILAYPVFARRYSAESIFRWGITVASTAYYAGYLVFGLAASYKHPSSQTSMIVLFSLAILSAINGGSETACTQILSSRSPSKAYLNKLNTVSEYVANASHGLGVLFGSNVWSIGGKYGILRGQLVWLVLVGMAIILSTILSTLTREKTWQEREEEEREVAAS